ncbi:aminotransferase class V-fold PLP-dependent enzyme [Reichenbachiella sp.]|uniref:aminotransferase class V-fold PLP-dependent enzyme n=1 Tax=Reichenbachiella sp. TaxID=2184521 RepID=UPI003B5AA2FB
MSIDWNQVRNNYQLPKQRTYFNSASFGAMSNQTVQVQMDCLRLWQHEGNRLNERTSEAVKKIRNEILDMTNARHHGVAIIPDVSTAMNQLAEVLQDKRKVALLKSDYPATSAPWLARGFEIEWVERKGFGFELCDIEDAIANGSKILVLSWVMYNSGTCLDLKAIGEMCKKHGVVFIVDTTQGLVANPLDLSETHVDIVLASAFKWMLGGYGISIAIASDEFVSNHNIPFAGQNTIIDNERGVDEEDNYRQGIERLELGHFKIQQVLALENALLELKELGFENIQERTVQLRDYLLKSLKMIDVEVITPAPMSSNILMIEATPARVERLKQSNIDFTFRHGLIRLGFYFYNNEKDVDRLIQALK